MMDHQQKSANRSMTPKATPSVNPFKKGDIIWVVYRKSINWPAKVTAYYPKDKKVSYVFFPLVPKNAVFKADPAKVQLFTLDDQLPENATHDLEQCFDQARRVLQGVPEEEIIAENVQKAQETPVQAKPKKKMLTTADALKKSTGTPKVTPKSHHKPLKSAAKETTNFVQGDPIIVDTPMGMWPGMFISYAKDDPNVVNYSLFPREEHSHEVVQTELDDVMAFPPDQIEQAIEDGRSSNSEVLLTALQDVQKYMNERGARHHRATAFGTTTSSSTSFLGTPLTAAHPTSSDLVKEKKAKKNQLAKVELTPPREAKQQPRMSLNSRLSSRVGDDENVVATPPMQKSKKRTASQMLHATVNDTPSAGPMVKRRKELGTDGADSDAAAANEDDEWDEEEEEEGTTSKPSLANLMNGGAENSATAAGKPRRLSEAERTRELANLGEKVEKVMRQKAMKEREQQLQQPQQQHLFQTTSSSPTPSPAIEASMGIKKAASEEAISTAKKGLPSYDLARSILCQQHIDSHLTNLGQQWFLEQFDTDDDLHIEFRKVGLFTCKELESLVSTARKWFEHVVYEKFLPNERFSDLRELCLVSTHVLPEIGAFVLSMQNDCSFEEARRIYAEKFASSSLPFDPSGLGPKQLQVHKQNNNKSLSTLLEAAKMMEGAASSEEQHQQQNGVSMPSSPTESSNAMPSGNTNNLTIQADTDSAGDSE